MRCLAGLRDAELERLLPLDLDRARELARRLPRLGLLQRPHLTYPGPLLPPLPEEDSEIVEPLAALELSAEQRELLRWWVSQGTSPAAPDAAATSGTAGPSRAPDNL